MYAGLNVREVGCRFGGGAASISLFRSTCNKDGGQGAEQGMNTIDERVVRGCIGDG